jgi:hypothetical protein
MPRGTFVRLHLRRSTTHLSMSGSLPAFWFWMAAASMR